MQLRAMETRTKILKAATELFAEKGLNGTTVDEIAVRAGVNKQRLYAYFGSKHRLFEAVLRDVFERIELFSRSSVARAKRHPERLTGILVRGFLKVHATHPYFWRLLAWANLEGPQCAVALDQVRKKENEELRRIFEQAASDGLIQNIRFETYLYSLLAVTYFRYSNALTLVYTLGSKPAGPVFEKQLANELNQVFSTGGGHDFRSRT